MSNGQETEKEESEKIYIIPKQLSFTEREIYAYIDKEWALVNTIGSDPSGLYVHLRVTNYPYTRWLCPKCGYNNAGYSKTCQREYPDGSKCERERPE
jgi:hypothetical protein